MGLMKKAARRATPRSIRKAKRVVKHPIGTAVGAATPRSIRKVKRTAFNAAHPVNTAENALLNAATPRRRGRSRSRSTSRDDTKISGAGWFAFVVWLVIEVIGWALGASGWWILLAFAGGLLAYRLGRSAEAAPQPEGPRQQVAPTGDEPQLAFPQRVTESWLQREVPGMSEASVASLLDLLVSRGWDEDEIEQRVRVLRA
jgi:hypothetical protein